MRCTQALEEVEARVRTFAEGCDALEGLQLLSEDSDGWAGLAASAADELQDQYPRKPMLFFGTRVAAPSPTTALTQALAAARWGGAASLRVPLQAPAAAPRLIYDARKPYHAAALMAAAIDTCTLPFRTLPAAQGQRQRSCSMHDMCEALSAPAATIATVGARLPAVSVAVQTGAAVDSRLSARERRLKGLPSAEEPHASADLLQAGLSWFSHGFDPLKGALATPAGAAVHVLLSCQRAAVRQRRIAHAGSSTIHSVFRV